MKLYQIVLVAFAALVIEAATDEVLWKQFQLSYGRTYKSALEEQQRYTIFKNKLRIIEEHNLKYENGDVTYYLGINKFADWTDEEFKGMLKLNEAKKPKARAFSVRPPLDVSLPNSVDWRESNAVTEVRGQQCGDCWAFSSTGSLEGQYAIKYGELIKMSEQNLIDCSSSYGNGGCTGGLTMYSFQYGEDFGINSEQDYPYEGVDGICRYNASKSLLKVDDYILSEIGNEDALQNAVATIGPISVNINASYIGMYAGGVFDYADCSSDWLNHAVLAVGYGVENNIPYWLVRNSWGTGFGEDGYIKMIRNKSNQCGIASAAFYPIISKVNLN